MLKERLDAEQVQERALPSMGTTWKSLAANTLGHGP